MNQVSEILGDKGHDVLRIDAGASVLEAVRQMIEANIGSLLVTKDGETAGIVTERDYLRRVAHEGPTDEEVTVERVFSIPDSRRHSCQPSAGWPNIPPYSRRFSC